MKQKEEAPGGREPTVLELLQRPDTVRVFHPAQDVLDGELWYGLAADRTPRTERALIMVTFARQAYMVLPEFGKRRILDQPSGLPDEVCWSWSA